MKLIMLVLPDGMDKHLFDDFPSDTLYAAELIKEDDFLDRDKMKSISECLARAFYNTARFKAMDKK